MKTAQELIKLFGMLPHPEGGYYAEQYRSDQQIYQLENGDYTGRESMSDILFLLSNDDQSHWHKIDADEQWTFVSGNILLLHYFDHDKCLQSLRLGNPALHDNVTPITTIPRGCWFAAEMEDKQTYALVSCVVAPAFNYDGFELASAQELLKLFPHEEDMIQRLSIKK